MANLRLATDSAFYDLPVASSQSLDAVAKAVPGDPPPLDGARASRVTRPQQLGLLRHGFPLGILPCLAPRVSNEVGGFALQTLVPAPSAPNWWAGLIGQFRPKKLILAIRKEVMDCDEPDLNLAKDIAKHFLDKSLYALGLFSQVSAGDDTSLLFNIEGHGDKKGYRTKATMVHNLPEHEITLEAAFPELFLDRSGTYWDVPGSVSLDLASTTSDAGFRYRLGLHQNSGYPQALNSSRTDAPSTLLPGLCAKAAFSYQKSKDFWREEVKEEKPEEPDSEEESMVPKWSPSYDIRLQEPHAAISGLIGGSFVTWLSKGNSSKRERLSGDLFGSLCYTLQRGKFIEDFNDLTRIDARLDISSAREFIKGAGHLLSGICGGSTQPKASASPLSSPRLSLILQQQVAGPIIFRVDSKFSLNSPSGRHIPHVEDVLCGLSYSLRMLESGKIFAWYSPKRKEAMIELRMFEF